MAYTNADIVPAALEGENAATPSNNFSTAYTKHIDSLASSLHPSKNWLEPPLAYALQELARNHKIEQIIWSFDTPIAIKVNDQWLKIDDRFSTTTSTRHQSQLYKLPGARSIPRDANAEEILRVADGLMRYTGSGYVAA